MKKKNFYSTSDLKKKKNRNSLFSYNDKMYTR